MKTTLRLLLALAVFCLVGSVAALLTGLGQPVKNPPLRFDPDPFVIPVAMVEDVEYDFEVGVVNASDESARIVGVEEFCSSACYYGRGLPAMIPSRGRGRVTIRVKANTPGPISEDVNFFTDRPSQPKLTLRIEGNIREDTLHELPILSSSHP